MDTLAIDRAKARLERAKKALAEFESAKSYEEAEAAWADFLIASSSVYAKLEQGAKRSTKSSAWFGRKKHARRIDPVLCYLHHARNSEEHGLELVTERNPDGGNNLAFGERQEWTIRPYDPQTGEQGEPAKAWMYGPHVKLAPVRDRGVVYEPPYKAVDPPGDPHAVGEYAVARLQEILNDAAAQCGDGRAA